MRFQGGRIRTKSLICLNCHLNDVRQEVMLYCVDTDGWVKLFDDFIDAEGYLEWFDLERSEYVIVDESGIIHEHYGSDAGSRGFKLRSTDKRHPAALVILSSHADGDQLDSTELQAIGSA